MGDAIGGKFYVVGDGLASICSSTNMPQASRSRDEYLDYADAGGPCSAERRFRRIRRKALRHGGRGGYGTGPYTTLEIYDPSTDAWTTGAPMPTGRECPGAAVLNGKMYVVGGYVRDPLNWPVATAVSVVEIYDPATNTWTAGPALPAPLANAVVETLDGVLYVAGGQDSADTPQSAVYRLDLASNTWKPAGSMLTARHLGAGAVVGGKLLAMGGYVNTGGTATTAAEIVATTAVPVSRPATPPLTGNDNSAMQWDSARDQTVSDDGRYLVYTSTASDLAANDTNGATQDVFLYDRVAKTVTLVSRNATGGSGNAASYEPHISADGNYVVYSSNASDLVAGDGNGTTDVFLWNRATQTTTLVSHVFGGNASGNNSSYSPTISANGQYVAYLTRATNVVPAKTADWIQDVVVFDRLTGSNVYLSHNVAGGQASHYSYEPTISGDGNFIAFSSNAPDLVANDTNGYTRDVFVYNRNTDIVSLVSVNSGGTGSGNSSSSNPTISANGAVVAFTSTASDLVANDTNGNTTDIFVFDRTTSTMRLASRNALGTGSGNGESSEPMISGNGAFVVYSSGASNLVAGDSNATTDVFLYDIAGDQVSLVSRTAGGFAGNGASSMPTISSTGAFVSFKSNAGNLVSNDSNATSYADIFSFERATAKVSLISRSPTALASGNNGSDKPRISGNGTLVAFQSDASNLVAPDINARTDVFIANVPVIPVSLGPVTPDPRNIPVSSVQAVFSKAIQLASFTKADLTLTRDGVAVDLSASSITISQIDPATYSIDNLDSVVTADGTYVLTVNAGGILDADGESGSGTASDSWRMDATGPTVTQVTPVSPDPRNTTVDEIFVTLSEAVDLATFTRDDLTLTRDSIPVTIPGGVTVSYLGGTGYKISGLASATAADGVYVLTVSAAAIADPLANIGSGSASDSWTMDATPPAIVAVENVSPDPRNTAVSTLDVTFSKAINGSTFTWQDLSLTRDASSVTLNSSVTVSYVTGFVYRISGLAGFTGTSGAYSLTVSAAGIQDQSGNFGSNSMSETWTADMVGPTVASITAVSPNPTQSNIDVIDLAMSEPVNLGTFTFADLGLTRNGSPLTLSSAVTIAAQGGSNYRISGLGGFTNADGDYVLTVSAVAVNDLVGNSGTGSRQTSWTRHTSQPSVVAVGPVTPDPRNSAVSSVDVVMSEPINLSTFTYLDVALTRGASPVTLNASVAVSQVSGTTYRISNLAGFTAVDGSYTLTVDATGIQDLFGFSGTNSLSDAWTLDTVVPHLTNVGPVTPSQRSVPVYSVDVAFDKAIVPATFTWQDVTLTRNGANLDASAVTVTPIDSTTFTLGNLYNLNLIDGNYQLMVVGSGIADAAGNAVPETQGVAWTLDRTGPVVQSVGPVVPDPRTVPVATIDVVLSEPVNLASFTYADLDLSRDGGSNLITSAATVSLVSGTTSTYRIANLGAWTAADGVYTLAVNGTGIFDVLGNPGTNALSDSWLMNGATPTVTSVGPVSPNPRNSAVDAIDVVFSEMVDLTSFDWNDLTLTRDGGSNLLSASNAIVPLGGSAYQITGLAGLTGAAGTYLLAVDASGVRDPQGGAGSGSLSTTWSTDTASPTIASVGPITPSPRRTPVTAVPVTFSEPIAAASFDWHDVTLTRDGGSNLIGSSAIVTALDSTHFEINLPAALTSTDGAYQISVLGSGIVDLAGNSGVGSGNASWTLETTAPSVLSFGALTPAPATAPTITPATFSEPIDGATFDPSRTCG
ncbi:MAG: Ig-like domain-containing protein [Gemmataceae bacterium]